MRAVFHLAGKNILLVVRREANMIYRDNVGIVFPIPYEAPVGDIHQLSRI